MTQVLYLHEPGVLQNLATRYELKKIYTYAGNILIAINPFESLPHLYNTTMMEQYKGATFREFSPHVFAVADVAYREMINKATSSSILVSGESGSGKTETAKILMKYLAYIGGRPEVERCTVEQKILESNPVLEAFGNAKTVNNNNSSRFSKFVGIQFGQSRSISGATIETCLLEKSRVCHIANGERNYHIFYRLCAAPPEVQEKYNLGSPKSFHYLKQSDCYELDAVNDADEYLATRKAMEIVGISEDEQEAIFRVVAAILHLGNIEFATGKEIDSSSIKDETRFHLNMTAELLKCNAKRLENALIKRVMKSPNEVVWRNLKAALDIRDALAKTIYSLLFNWIVKKINNSIGQDRNSKSIIGVLDITGFESFDHNSFEQFCINYSNEKLQQHFNQHVSEMKQKEYTKGETKWSSIDFARNQAVLNLIEDKPGGIIALLDDACLFPKSTHGKFAQKWYDAFKNNEHFTIPKGSQSTFTISHNGGEKQLQSLMDKLNTMKPQYIRCMKPNNCLKPAIFENHNIVRQLRRGGVLKAILICARYPTREFAHPSAVLAPKAVEGNHDDKALCKRTPDKMGLKGDQANQGEIQTYDSYGSLVSWCECDRIHPAIKENVDLEIL